MKVGIFWERALLRGDGSTSAIAPGLYGVHQQARPTGARQIEGRRRTGHEPSAPTGQRTGNSPEKKARRNSFRFGLAISFTGDPLIQCPGGPCAPERAEADDAGC